MYEGEEDDKKERKDHRRDSSKSASNEELRATEGEREIVILTGS